MINANELRIGNWVTVKYILRSEGQTTQFIEPMQANAISEFKVGFKELGEVDYIFIEPILLTDSILKDAGFTTVYGSDFVTYSLGQSDNPDTFNFNAKFLISYSDYLHKGFFHECHKKGDIKYVHQLQNLYFTALEEELVIKFVKQY
jgi:hypothetical protein